MPPDFHFHQTAALTSLYYTALHSMQPFLTELEEGRATRSRTVAWESHGQRAWRVPGRRVAKSQTFIGATYTFTFTLLTEREFDVSGQPSSHFYWDET